MTDLMHEDFEQTIALVPILRVVQVNVTAEGRLGVAQRTRVRQLAIDAVEQHGIAVIALGKVNRNVAIHAVVFVHFAHAYIAVQVLEPRLERRLDHVLDDVVRHRLGVSIQVLVVFAYGKRQFGQALAK